MEQTPVLDGLGANLSTLYKLVCDMGGFDVVEKASAWSRVVQTLSEVTDLAPATPTIDDDVRALYATYLLPLELFEATKSTKIEPTKADPTPLPRTDTGTPDATKPSLPDLLAAPVKRGRGRPRKADAAVRAIAPRVPSTPPPPPTTADGDSTTPTVFPGFIKRGRGRPRKADSLAMRLLGADAQVPVDPTLLETSALAVDPLRTCRLPPPSVRVGQKFYRCIVAGTAVLGEVKRVLPGKKPMVVVEYPGDCDSQMLRCSGCSGGYHTFCLSRPIACVPPGDWYCEVCIAEQVAQKSEKFGFETGAEHTLASFKAKADAWQLAYFATPPSVQQLEAEYWRVVTNPDKKIQVEYGSDVDTGAMGSGFPTLTKVNKLRNRLVNRFNAVHESPHLLDPTDLALKRVLAEDLDMQTVNQVHKYATSPWNLNNLPKLNGSMLQYLNEDIKGVMVPWMYVGMCFSTFCWHVEDHNFYSISYLHRGAPKTWYGVPGHAAAKMESVMRKLTPGLFGSQPDLHMQLHGVPVYRATHNPNEFIITYPSSYHGGFNNGFNLAEAVNFATPDWIAWGHTAVQNYKKFSKIPVFSHDALLVTVTLASLEGTNALDSDSVRSYLLPSLKTLRDETVAFWDAVRQYGITKSEAMDGYLESHGRSTFSRASARIRLATAADDDEDDPPPRPSKMMRSDKMGGKMMASNSRAARQVLWAGRSGKHDGLRCSQCQQYCYVAAVVCFKCRAIGCADHFNSQCKCDAKANGIWLHHVDTAVLSQYIDTLERKFQDAQAWEARVDGAVTLDDLTLAVAQGDQLIAQHVDVPIRRLYQEKLVMLALHKWQRHVKRCLETGTTLKELDELAREAASFKYTMPQVHQISTLMEATRTLQEQAQLVVHEMKLLKADNEGGGDADDDDDGNSMEALQREAAELDVFAQTIETLLANLRPVTIPETAALQTDLAYVNWLRAANALVMKAMANSSAVLSSAMTLYPTLADIDLVWSSCPVKTVRHLDRVAHLRQACIDEGLKWHETTANNPKSVEEMERLLQRLVRLPAFPQEVVHLLSKWKQAKLWTDKATKALAKPKLGWNDALALEAQADSTDVPMSSLLRRQLHGRIQDGNRWIARTNGLFKWEGTAVHSLQETLERNAVEDEITSSLICICEQTYHEHVPVLRCTGYHAKCIGLSPAVLSSLEAYRCNACAIRQHIPPRHPARPNWKQVRAHIARGESLQIHVPGLDELKALVAHGLDVIADVTAFEQSFLDRCALATIAHRMDTLAQELDDKVAAVRRVESLVLLDPAKHKLLPLQWFLHACRLIFCSTPAPRYSQLVVLLNDVALHKLEFPTPELDRFYREIERKLARAVTWVTQVKAMDMKAPSCDLVALQAEAEEISHFLVL
ncbi:hypothetical protein DYB30_007130, partial [Aphanomyces astaci]